MRYEFRKVYADLLTSDGAALVVYHTWLTLLGRTWGSTGAELYRPDGSRTLLHGLGAPPPVGPDDLPDHLRVETAAGPLVLDLAVEHGPFDPGAPSTCPALCWRVLALRTAARARLPDGEVLEGQGYVDWVSLIRPTRTLHFRTLRWGRAHVAGRSLSFMDLAMASGDRWRVGVARDDVATHPACVPDLAFDGGDGEVGFGPGGPRLALTARRELHRGSAFDPERVPDPLHRAVVAVLGGPHGERRWLAEAGVGPDRGLALHEVVGFGPAAAAIATPSATAG